MALVGITRAKTYDLDLVTNAFSQAVDLCGGINHLLEKGNRLLLKPNMLSGVHPSRAVTTHPVFFEAAVIYFKQKGFTLSAGDSPAIESTENAGRKNGILAIAKRHGVKWCDFSDAVELHNPEGKLVKKFLIARALTLVDAVVSLPKLKTHTQMYFTGAVKNMYGALPGLNKSKNHVRFPDRSHFARMIVDVNILVPPEFSVMDGITAMEGDGPQNGTPFDLGLILASRDPFALDTAACKIIGYNPADIPILTEGCSRAKWINSPEEAEFAGLTLAETAVPHFKKVHIPTRISFPERGAFKPLAGIIQNALITRPFFPIAKCIKCNRCVEICSANALAPNPASKTNYITIDYSKCIRCYCCHEICPANAIELKRKVW